MRVRQTERRSMPCECADVICALLVPRPEVGARTLRARKRGGIARTSRRATLSADAPHRALGTVADVLSLLEEAANEQFADALLPSPYSRSSASVKPYSTSKSRLWNCTPV